MCLTNLRGNPENDKDVTENWGDEDQLCFTTGKRARVIGMTVEDADDLPSCHQLLQDSSQGAQIEQKKSIKMEPVSEAEDNYSSFVDSFTNSKTQNTAEGNTSTMTGPRKVRMNISSDMMEKFLKEGKLEKQASGSYRVMENVFKEIEESICGSEAPAQTTASPSKNLSSPTVVFRRKRGRPRKGTFIPRTTPSQDSESVVASHSQASCSSPQTGKMSSKTSTTMPLIYDSTEDPGDAETDTDNKPKRKRRSKVLDDYVADFNTSDEEDMNLTTGFSKFTNRGRGRGRGRRAEPSLTFDDDLFTSYVSVFGKKFSLQEDFPDEDMLEGMSDNEEDMYSPSSSNKSKLLEIAKQGDDIKDRVEAMIGPSGKTKVQIVDTGETSFLNDEENVIYHVITTTGKKTSTIPLLIPKVMDDGESEADSKDLPSTSHIKPTLIDEEKLETDIEVDGTKPKLSSRGRRIKSKQLNRTYNQQVASLRQRYCRAVQELRKRPRVYTLADLVYGASRFLTEDQLVFFTLQLKSGCNNMQGIRFSVREKMLALAFYLQSPALYKWLRVIFHLPTKLILERWLEGIAKSDPDAAKRLMYHVYTRYVFRS
ncbi:uncharacterized protein LOC121855119 isoform X2 [Homarus americanus]|uniref:uncharacterized protein LOC121855119 isoform X2 n=1 Tax=Homarus americanus TaxID=6706 RepID=UPI001C46379F|nr:uncharacterized protein LOC121855119 isoform X2 [Homarus americanus]